ncbi:hypothetical protein Ahy_A07g036932 [Arachis hypogaea]|uniref:SWIM-type domain-containing protein n=1 Tax=Arachis hypogaea TaxID=3818 RepID=A0A445CHF4_ARAHY|nr:hypothetical protein Ahy_A07g036932 [Arachis hypogaea]
MENDGKESYKDGDQSEDLSVEYECSSNESDDMVDVTVDEAEADIINAGDIWGLAFDTKSQVCEFYAKYAKCYGFVSRKDLKTVDVNGNINTRQLVCNKAGERHWKHLKRDNRQREHRAITRVNCKARIRFIRHYRTGKWKVSVFESEHNHPLCPPKHYRNNHLTADFDTFYKFPVLTTCLESFEKQAAELYTRNIFKLVKDEIEAAGALNVTECPNSGDIVEYSTSEYFNQQWEFKVSYNKDKDLFACECRLFETRGLPFSHIFGVLKHRNANCVPTSLILKRWTRDAKSDFICSIGEQDAADDITPTLRRGAMASICWKLCDISSKNSADYREISGELLKLISKVQNKGDAQARLSPTSALIGDPAVVKSKGAPRKVPKGKKRRRCSRCISLGQCPLLAKEDSPAEYSNAEDEPMVEECDANKRTPSQNTKSVENTPVHNKNNFKGYGSKKSVSKLAERPKIRANGKKNRQKTKEISLSEETLKAKTNTSGIEATEVPDAATTKIPGLPQYPMHHYPVVLPYQPYGGVLPIPFHPVPNGMAYFNQYPSTAGITSYPQFLHVSSYSSGPRIQDYSVEFTSNDELLSIDWVQKLLGVFICCHEEFRTILLNNKEHVSKPPLDRLISEFFEKSVKALDICNASRDGVEKIRTWQKHLDIVLSALGSNKRALNEGQFRRARKALMDLALAMLEEKDSGSVFSQRNRSFGRHNSSKDQHSAGHSRSHSWSVSRSWSAAKQLQSIASNLVPPRGNEISATRGLAVPVYTMNCILLFVLWTLVAAIPCQDRGLNIHFSVSRQFSWSVPNSNGLLKEIYRVELCTRHLTDLVDSPQFPLTEDQEMEIEQDMKELTHVCEAFRVGLDPLERQVREAFRKIMTCQTEGFDYLGSSSYADQ